MQRLLLCFVFLVVQAFSTNAQQLDYKNIELSQFRDLRPVTIGGLAAGKPTYLKLWATWCKPCMEQMPHFAKLHQQYGDQINFIAVNININENRAHITDVIKRFALKMPVLLDNDGKLGVALGLVGTPYSVLTNSAAEVVYTSHESDDNLDRIISMLAKGQQLPASAVKVVTASEKQQLLQPWAKGEHLLFFTATWCDWYLADTRPDMAAACKQAQSGLNQLAALLPNYSWYGVVNHLWTDDKALADFNQLYQMKVTFSIDTAGVLFNEYKISSIPTLLHIKDGKVVALITDFKNNQSVIEQLTQK